MTDIPKSQKQRLYAFEYHIVEKKIVPWIAKYFTKEVA